MQEREMISSENLDWYTDLFGCQCGYEESSGSVCVLDEKGECYIAPETETNETFADRLRRSKAAGRNLFVVEWEVAPPIPEGVDM